MTFQLTDAPPPAVSGIGSNRGYNRYDEQSELLRANPGRWLLLSTVEIQPKQNDDGTTQSADEAEKDARRRAGNRVSMIKQRKGVWANAEWATVIAQPGGPGTSFELHVSFVKDIPKAEVPAEDNGHAATGADATAEASVSAEATVSDEHATDSTVGEPTAEPTAEPAPRRRRLGL